MKIIGIDLGSRSVKLVAFEENRLVYKKIIDTSVFYRDYCSNVNRKISINFEKLRFTDFDKIVSTGYGRNNVNVENAEVITELKAHVYGAIWQTGIKSFTLLDIGGQDSKIISVREGKMVDMLLNDKCAASCGRYLENMANVLGIDIHELSGYYENYVELSSTCAVFGESELIGRISEGYSIEALSAGVNYSLYKRIKPLIERFPHEYLIATGGVVKNKALIHFIKSEMGFKYVIVPENSQLNGAIGCCSYYITKI